MNRHIRTLEEILATERRILEAQNRAVPVGSVMGQQREIDTTRARISALQAAIEAMRACGTGDDGIRDPDAPCEFFFKGPLHLGDEADCQGDGHRLCSECVRKLPAQPPEQGEGGSESK